MERRNVEKHKHVNKRTKSFRNQLGRIAKSNHECLASKEKYFIIIAGIFDNVLCEAIRFASSHSLNQPK